VNSDSKSVLTYLALGGNVGNVEKTFSGVCSRLADELLSGQIRFSKLYQTAPWGVENQNDFFNLIVELEWSGSLDELARLCFKLEEEWGRDRQNEVRWGPRPIDIDIIMFGDLQIETAELEIPHPRMHLRKFVLQPMMDLTTDTIIPGLGMSISQSLDNCDDNGDVFPINVVAWKPI